MAHRDAVGRGVHSIGYEAGAMLAGLPHPRSAQGRGMNLGGRGDGLRAARLPRKQGGHAERMEKLGPVILMDGKRFEAGLTSEGQKVTKHILAKSQQVWT